MFVAAERQGERWTVQADALTAPGHAIDATVQESVRAAVYEAPEPLTRAVPSRP